MPCKSMLKILLFNKSEGNSNFMISTINNKMLEPSMVVFVYTQVLDNTSFQILYLSLS